MKKVYTILSIAFFIAACNPVKRVLKNKEQFEKLGAAWELEHPCTNDTTTIFVPGDTIKTVKQRIDTLYQTTKFNDTTIITRFINKEKTINNTVHDTINKTIVDDRKVKSLEKALDQTKTDLTKSEKTSQNRFWLLIGSVILNLIFIMVLLKKSK